MSVPEVEETNISCEAGMEESFPGRPAQHRPFQVGQIFTLIGFGPANCSQIFDGYEFTSKISRQI